MSLIGSNNEQKIWNYLKSKGLNNYGISGLMGNIFAESGLNPMNLQNNYEKSLKYSDEEYCKAVDNGTYINFVQDKAGWGLCQWTFWSRKENLLKFAQANRTSIGDLEMQLDFLWKELSESYKSVLNVLKTATSVLEASNAVLLNFERPKDTTVDVQNRRATYGQNYYNKYASTDTINDPNNEEKKLNEKELREKVVSVAIGFIGRKESDGTHREIIDIYNGKKPLPANYKVTYTDAWCATYVSAVGIVAGLDDIVFRECGCNRMIDLYKKAGRWVEDDAYTPQIGDVIFYDWQDNGMGDNTGSSDHVGIIVSVNGTTLKIAEGNITDSVGYRTLRINGKYIRGYGIPDYASKVNGMSGSYNDKTEENHNPVTPGSSVIPAQMYNIGDIVEFIGRNHYTSSNSMSAKLCSPGTAKVTGYCKNANHPYHLIAEKGKGSTVYGWVNDVDISRKITSTSSSGSGTNTTINSSAKIDYAKSFDKAYKGSYRATTGLNMRSGAGTSKSIITVIPKNGEVTCYGYYTMVNGVPWYYVTYKNPKRVLFTGFVSSRYLK